MAEEVENFQKLYKWQEQFVLILKSTDIKIDHN